MSSHQLLHTQQSHQEFIWPMPQVEDIFSKLNGAKYFSTLDLWAGYQHITLDKSSIPKIAFDSPFGKYEYVKVPFGLAQAPAYFQELMTGILKDFDFAIAYLDDIIIFSTTVEEHLSQIKKSLWETTQMSFLYKGNTILRTHPQHQGHPTITFKNTSHLEHPSTTNAQTSLHIPWFSRILQKVYQEFCENSQTINTPNTPACEMSLDTDSSWCFPDTQGIHYSSTNTMIPKP